MYPPEVANQGFAFAELPRDKQSTLPKNGIQNSLDPT